MKALGAIALASLLLGGLFTMVIAWRRREKKFWSRVSKQERGGWPGAWFVALWLGGLAVASIAGATDYHVGPNGVGTSNCTANVSPWCSIDFARNFANRPGDTIYFHGGTYSMVPDSFGYTCFRVTGNVGNLVTLRPYVPAGSLQGERVTIIDTAQNPGLPVIGMCGAYVRYIGFEITALNNANRYCSVSDSSCTTGEIHYGESISVRQNDVTVAPTANEVINLVIHGLKQGPSLWIEMTNGKAYGNIVYDNGWDAPDRGHGHGFYIQAAASGDARTLSANIVFRNGSHGFHWYGSSPYCSSNVTMKDNIVFGNGNIPQVGGDGRDFLMGGTCVTQNSIVDNNVFWGSGWQWGWSNWPPNSQTSSFLRGNVIHESPTLLNIAVPGGLTVGGAGALANTFIYTALSGFTAANYPLNTYIPVASYLTLTGCTGSPCPSIVKATINAYEATRCDVTIINPQSAATVNVNLATSCGFNTNDSISIRYVGNYYGTAVNATDLPPMCGPVNMTLLRPSGLG